jgi:hypothetical protein
VRPDASPAAPEGWRDTLAVDGLLLCVREGQEG